MTKRVLDCVIAGFINEDNRLLEVPVDSYQYQKELGMERIAAEIFGDINCECIGTGGKPCLGWIGHPGWNMDEHYKGLYISKNLEKLRELMEPEVWDGKIQRT